MALDPLIANPKIPEFKFADPLVQYNNYLLAASRKGAMDKARREQADMNALNALYRKYTDASGVVNFNALRGGAALEGLGHLIPGMLEDEGKRSKLTEETNKLKAETGLTNEKMNTEKADQGLKGAQAKKADAETRGEKAKTFDQKWKTSRELLGSVPTGEKDLQQAVVQAGNWIGSQFNDPDIGPVLVERGMTKEQMVADLKAAAKAGHPAFIKWLNNAALGVDAASKKNITTEDLGGHKRIVETNASSLGTSAPNVVSDQKVTVDPNSSLKAPKTTVYNNVVAGTPAVNSFQEKAGGVMGEDFANLVKLNKGFEMQVAGIDRALDVLDSGAVITGMGAKPKLDAVRLAKALGANVDDKTLQNTELLSQQIATSVFNRIAALKAQGVALTPMSNTDLAKIEAAGPQAWNDAGTIKRLFQIERETVQNARRMYNSQAQHYRTQPMTSNAVQALGAAPMSEIADRGVKGTNGKIIPPSVIQRFLQNKNNPAHVKEIDRLFGAGTAKRLAGGN